MQEESAQALSQAFISIDGGNACIFTAVFPF
jgi:hypothetical protein